MCLGGDWWWGGGCGAGRVVKQIGSGKIFLGN